MKIEEKNGPKSALEEKPCQPESEQSKKVFKKDRKVENLIFRFNNFSFGSYPNFSEWAHSQFRSVGTRLQRSA